MKTDDLCFCSCFFARALIVADSNYDWLVAFSTHIVSCFIVYLWASLTNQNAFVVKKEFLFYILFVSSPIYSAVLFRRMDDPQATYEFPSHFNSSYKGGFKDGM